MTGAGAILADRLRRIGRGEHARYLCIGAVCALVNNVVLIAGTWLGYHYALLTVLSSFISGSIGYALHARYSFRAPAQWRAYLQYLSGTSVGIPLAILTLAVLINGLRLPMWIASPTSTVIMVIYNYGFARLAIVGRLTGQRAAGQP